VKQSEFVMISDAWFALKRGPIPSKRCISRKDFFRFSKTFQSGSRESLCPLGRVRSISYCFDFQWEDRFPGRLLA